MCLPSCWVPVCSSLLRSCWPGCVSCALNSSSWIRAHSIQSVLHHTQIHTVSLYTHAQANKQTASAKNTDSLSVLYVSNHHVFAKLSNHFCFADGVTNTESSKALSLLQLQAKVRKFGPKILQLLTEWTETFPTDFRDEKMVGHLKDIIHRIAPCDEVYTDNMEIQLYGNINMRWLNHVYKIKHLFLDHRSSFKRKKF